MRIHQRLQSREFPNAATLARQLEVSTKSVHRDLEFMRDRLELPLEWDPQRRGYRYTQEVSGFPTLQITEGELFALLVAEKALQQYRGTSFERPLLSAFKKIADSLPETISLNLTEWEQTISFRTSATPLLNLEIFDSLARATARHEQVKLSYRKPGQSTTEERTVDPYHLANINGEWFLFAFDHSRKDVRTFVPARIKAVQLTGHGFKPPRKFSLDQRLRDSFGVHSGQGDFEIRIQFSEFAADYVREKRWHPSQQLTELPDGKLELKVRLSGLVEIQRWILSWGGEAEVLSPPELAERVRNAAQRLLKVHAAKS